MFRKMQKKWYSFRIIYAIKFSERIHVPETEKTDFLVIYLDPVKKKIRVTFKLCKLSGDSSGFIASIPINPVLSTFRKKLSLSNIYIFFYFEAL